MPSIGYLVNQYPAPSHTFIRREIRALERRGYEIERIALRGWDAELADDEDCEERLRTRYVLRDGLGPLVWALVRAALASPRRFAAALILALRTARRAERSVAHHLAYLAEACRIVPWLKACGATHLHAHFGSNSATVAMFAHALGGPPYSFTVHGPDEFDKPQSLRIAEKVRRSAFVVAISSHGRSQLYRWIEHTHWSKVKLVRCGLERSSDEAPPAPPAAPRLACVGRLCQQKGQLLLVEAAARLAAKGIAFELVLVGDGELRGPLEALIARHGLGERVRITGWLSGAAVRREILGARVFVLPSFAEGLPVAIMEAMALARPVLSTYVAGIPELVRPGEHGWLCPPGDLEALVAALEDALSRPARELAVMGEAARRRVLERHCLDTQAARLAGLFDEARAQR